MGDWGGDGVSGTKGFASGQSEERGSIVGGVGGEGSGVDIGREGGREGWVGRDGWGVWVEGWDGGWRGCGGVDVVE